MIADASNSIGFTSYLYCFVIKIKLGSLLQHTISEVAKQSCCVIFRKKSVPAVELIIFYSILTTKIALYAVETVFKTPALVCLLVYGSSHVYKLVLSEHLKSRQTECLNEQGHFDGVHSAVQLL